MNNIKVFYVRNDWKKRDITIVSNLIEQDGKKVVKCGWSFRSNHDQFIKKEGREIATTRMNGNDPAYSISFEVDEPKFRTISVNILKSILSKSTTPRKYIQDIEYEIDYLSNEMYWKFMGNAKN